MHSRLSPADAFRRDGLKTVPYRTQGPCPRASKRLSLRVLCVLRGGDSLPQKSNWTLIFANRAVTIVVGTRQPVAVALL